MGFGGLCQGFDHCHQGYDKPAVLLHLRGDRGMSGRFKLPLLGRNTGSRRALNLIGGKSGFSIRLPKILITDLGETKAWEASSRYIDLMNAGPVRIYPMICFHHKIAEDSKRRGQHVVIKHDIGSRVNSALL